jgi:hypothetical protein
MVAGLPRVNASTTEAPKSRDKRKRRFLNLQRPPEGSVSFRAAPVLQRNRSRTGILQRSFA